MRKQLIPSTPETVRPHGERWLNLERAAAVEVTSEEENFPVESALVLGETRGWRAAIPGTQTIRLVRKSRDIAGHKHQGRWRDRDAFVGDHIASPF